MRQEWIFVGEVRSFFALSEVDAGRDAPDNPRTCLNDSALSCR